MLRVEEIGEQGLLERLQAFCPRDVVGDDAAVLTPEAGRSLIITSDVLVDGVHFSLGMALPNTQTTSPEDAGWRAAAANLSDLAAMGADPLGITIGLAVPKQTPVAWLEQLYQGIAACLQPYDTAIVGGDVCRSPVLTVAITAFGQADPHQIIRRSAARPGDAILATGVHGASRAGLELLLYPEQGQALSAPERLALIQAHQRPIPRLDVLPYLRTLRPDAESGWAIAGMDSSDGLADAILQICRASGVGAIVDRACIPIPTSLNHWITSTQALDWALYGGEDFELVLCLPIEMATAIAQQIGNTAAIVGTIRAEPGVRLVDSTGQYPDEELRLNRGFQHF